MIARSLSHLPDILSQTPDAANLQSVCAYNVKIYHGGDREFVFSHFSPSFATDHFYHAGLFSVSLISIKFIKRLDQTADDSFPGSLKCEARNRSEGAAADARPVFERIFAFPLCFESSIKLGEKNFCIFENNSENPLAVGKFGIGVQIQIACSTMSDLNLCVRCHDPRVYLLYFRVVQACGACAAM